MVLFIEEDCERVVASKVAERRKTEKEADAPEYRVGCHHRAAFQPGEIPCNVSSRDYKYRAVRRENNDNSLTSRGSALRNVSMFIATYFLRIYCDIFCKINFKLLYKKRYEIILLMYF